MRQWLAAAGGNTRAPTVAAGRGGELRGPGIDDDVAAEQHAAGLPARHAGVLPAELPVTPALPVEGNDILGPPAV
jgi:hypothetical protein